MENKMYRQKGLSLIELMITVAVLGIIAAIAIPAYDAQKRRGFRSDAVITLTTISQLQERNRSQAGAYTTDLEAIYEDATPGNGTITSPQGKYTITVSNVGTETFTLTATAIGSQLGDTACRVFTLTHTGLRSSTDDGGTTTTGTNSNCWPK